MRASSKRAIVASVAADVAIAAVKFLGAAFTRSSVMVAESIHSLVDGANASLMLLGQKRAARPPNERHPFGHGNEVYFWSAVVAMVAFVVGGGFAVVEGFYGWHEPPRGPIWPNLAILAAAFAFNGISLAIALRELERYKQEKGYTGGVYAVIQQSHDPPIFLTVLLDVAALIGIVIAAVGVVLERATGRGEFDAAASMLDGVVMMAAAGVLAAETRSLIIGEAARRPLVDDARRIAAHHVGIRAVDDLRTLQLGPDSVLVVLHARFADELTAHQVSRVGRDLEDELRRRHPSIQHVVFDFD
jgi:cation diffusion facilitator family transporter